MALRVWLPLNGTLENKGISDLVFSNDNTTNIVIDNNGKIGKCYSRTTKKTAGRIISDKNINLNGDISICCWAYVSDCVGDTANGLVSIHSHSNNTGIGITIKQISTSDYRISCNTGYGSGRTYCTYYGTTNIKNAWHHLTITYSKLKAQLLLYVDGNLEYTLNNYNNASKDDKIIIFDWSTSYNGPAYRPASKLNDVRIYDHCLSAKEVKEISQGLVLHYKLDGFSGGAGDNILINTSFNSQYTQSSGWDISKNGTHLASSWGGYNSGVGNQATVYHAHLKEFNNEWVYEYHKTADETWLGISQGGLQTKLKAGETYTFSWEEYHVEGTNRVGTGLYYFKTGATSANFHLGIQQAQTVTRVNNQWQKFTYTFVAPTDADWSKNMSWYMYGHYNGNGIFYMRNPKLEKGSVATSWLPALSEMGIDTTKITDSSGYGNDGIINGNLITNNNTSRYSSSTFFDGNTAAIKIPFNDIIKDKNYTVSCWTYKTTIGTKKYQTILGGPSGFELEARSSSNTSPLYRIHNWGGGTTPYEFNKWNHFCFVHTDTDSKLYVNGELKITGTSANIPTGNYFIGSWSTATSQNYEGQMSDFRLYATALSAEDILDLYHTPANIDNLGGIHGFEMVEDTSSRELLALPWTTSYTNHTKTSLWTNFNEKGEWTSNTNSSSSTDYIKINPTGKAYYYDAEISVAAGNQFYIGFERYDANKTPRSNAACVYIIAIKPNNDINHQRYFGTVNLATDGTNPTDTITLRVLNAWSGTDSSSTKEATIHYLSLREVTGTPQTGKIKKQGQIYTDEFVEREKQASIYENGFVGGHGFIEK